VAVGAAAMMLVSGCGVLSQASAQETVLIAADLELTGAGSDLGAVYREALQLRVDQVNQAGLLGDRRLELLVLDNRSDSATAASNIAELAANPEVAAIVMGGCDECALAAVDPVNEAGVPTIALAAASQVTEPVEERRYMFQLGPTAADIARVLAEELDRDEAETIGLVTTGDLYGEEGRQQMSDAVDRVGVEVVVSETVNAEEGSVRSAAEAILAYQPEQDFTQGLGFQPDPTEPEQPPGPDAVVMWAPAPLAGQLAATLRDQGYEGSFLLDSSAADELFLSGAEGQALNGARMVFTETLVIDGVIASSPAKAARQTWFNNYTAQQGTYHAYSSFAADAVQVVVEAINQFDRTDRESVRTALENTQIDGFSGPIRFRLETHSGLSSQALTTLVAQGDRWRLATG
jgi:branched-chain amino acid transport system substrate-binding protein